MAVCRNCGHATDSSYCPECGQSTAVKRLEMNTLLRDLPNVLWNADRGLLFNLVQLYARPGYSVKDYLDGKRRNFQHPVSFMLIVLALMLIAMNLMEVHYYDPVQDAGMTADQAAFWREYDATQQAWIHHYKYYIPFYLPWMALLYFGWLRVMQQPYTYAESLCISCFFSAQMTLLQIAVLALAFVIGSTAFTRVADQLINWPIVAGLAGVQFYQLGNPSVSRGRRLVLAGIGALLMLVFAFVMIFLFLRLAQAAGL